MPVVWTVYGAGAYEALRGVVGEVKGNRPRSWRRAELVDEPPRQRKRTSAERDGRRRDRLRAGPRGYRLRRCRAATHEQYSCRRSRPGPGLWSRPSQSKAIPWTQRSEPLVRARTVKGVGDSGTGPTPADAAYGQGSGGQQDRQEWVRANFTQISGISAEDLQAQGINPRQYAREHRDNIRQFAQLQRSQGLTVPSARGPGGGPRPASGGPYSAAPPNQAGGYGGSGRRYGQGMRGGTAWIGVLILLFALRFLLVDSFAGSHAAFFWVLGIGGIMLVARVLLFSWLRRRRASRRQ